MTILKFECPGCGQHMECDRVCGGDIIHCPRCCAEIRIPFPGTGHIEGSIARAELIGPQTGQPLQSQWRFSREAVFQAIHAQSSKDTLSCQKANAAFSV